jgi:pSer/pThr/pTyr-binding forkhead associated (FHA) protein
MAILALMVDGVAVSKFDLAPGDWTLGRSASCEIHIDDLAVSSQHARIRVSSDPYFEGLMRYECEDLGSTNGTFLNEKKLVQKTLLKDGDVLRIGYHRFKFINEEAPDFERTAVILPDTDL